MNHKSNMQYQNKIHNNYDNMSMSSNTSAMNFNKLRQTDLFCQNHQEQLCCNYCVQHNCFQPLCSECIQDHLIYHKKYGYSDLAIKSIRTVRKDCIVKLNKLIQQLIQKLSLLENPPNTQVIIEEMEDKLLKIKNHIYELVEQEIAKVRESLRMKVTESINIVKGMQQIHTKLESLIQQLRQTCFVLSDGKKSANFTIPDSIKKTLTLDSGGLLETFERQSINYSNKHKKIDFDIIFNPQSFKSMFSEVIKVTNLKSNSKDISSSSMSFNMQKGKPLKNSPLSNVYEHYEHYEHSISLFPEQPQFQSHNKILHFFQTGSNKLHLISLEQEKKKKHQIRPQMKIITINEFVVPSFHASLLSQINDCIFLSGGILELNGISKSPLFMRYSIKTQYCKKDFAKVRARSSHTLCQDSTGDYVYILGGYGQNVSMEESNSQPIYETTVEKVNTKSGKIDIQAMSNWGGTNIAFHIKSYIVKASEEGVELYNPKNKQWVIADIKMHPKGDFYYYKNSGFTLISDTGLLVYGGYQYNQEEVDQCFYWKISVQNKSFKLQITQMNCKLPQAEGFYNNPGIIDKNNIYAIQNIEDQIGCKDDERLLLRFDFTDQDGIWKKINIEDEE